MYVLSRDLAADGHRDGDVGRAPSGDALAPILRFDFVNAGRRALADPPNVFYSRVDHRSAAIATPCMIDPRTRRGRGSLEAQRVAERARHVEVDVGPGIPGDGDLHEAASIATAVIDHTVAVVIDRITGFLDRSTTVTRDLARGRNRDDRDERRGLDDRGNTRRLLLHDLVCSLRGGSLDPPPRTRRKQQDQSDRGSFRHPAGTIAEVTYNADAMMESLLEAKNAVSDRTGAVDIALVLGSGLGRYSDGLGNAVSIPYADIPNMPTAAVAGHAGNLVVGDGGGRRVAAMQGRAHLYEGWSPQEVVFGVRLMAQLGARTLIVTNAAGGIAPQLSPGDLMAITDQLNLTGTSSLLGPNDERLGPRFIDMTDAYDPGLIDTASAVARRLGFELRRGVYAGLLGPAYETPAEVRMLRTLGADAVGMSTVLEVLAARHLGMRVLGISCISNLAAGISERPLSHEEVRETASRVETRFESLLSGILEAS